MNSVLEAFIRLFFWSGATGPYLLIESFLNYVIYIQNSLRQSQNILGSRENVKPSLKFAHNFLK